MICGKLGERFVRAKLLEGSKEFTRFAEVCAALFNSGGQCLIDIGYRENLPPGEKKPRFIKLCYDTIKLKQAKTKTPNSKVTRKFVRDLFREPDGALEFLSPIAAIEAAPGKRNQLVFVMREFLSLAMATVFHIIAKNDKKK